MAEYDASSLSKSIAEKRANFSLRHDLIDSMLAFTLGVAHVVGDRWLLLATNLVWERSDLPMEEQHSFTYENTSPIVFPEGWYAGGLIVPNMVRIGLHDDRATYNFMQKFDDEERAYREVDIVIDNPRDIAFCSWSMSILDRTDEVHTVNLPPNDDMTSDSNDDFSVMSNNILQALRPGTATRTEYEQ